MENSPGAASPVPATTGDHPRRWLILAVMSLATLIVQVDQSGMTIALPGLQRDLTAGIAQLQWVMDAYSLALAAFVLAAGAASDRLGRKRVFLTGIAVFALASVAGALAGDIAVVITARAVLGVGAAMFMPGTLSLLIQAFGEASRARAIGVWGAITSLGIVVGPLLGGTLLQYFDWRAIFVMNLVVAATAFGAAAAVVPESRDPQPRRSDPAGTLLSAAGLLSLVYGIIVSSERGTGALEAVAGVAVGVTLLGAFWRWARRRPDGMFDVAVAGTRTFRAAALAAATMMFVMTGVLFVLTQQLQLVQHFSALLTGVAVPQLAAAAFASSMLAPALAARTSPRLSITAGLLLLAAAALVFAVAQPIGGYLPVLVVLTLAGLGVGFVAAVANDVLMASGPRERSGLISAMNDTIQECGAALGVAIVGALLASGVGGSIAGLTHAAGDSAGAVMGFADGSRSAALAAAAAALLGAVGVAVLLRNGDPSVANSTPPVRTR